MQLLALVFVAAEVAVQIAAEALLEDALGAPAAEAPEGVSQGSFGHALLTAIKLAALVLVAAQGAMQAAAEALLEVDIAHASNAAAAAAAMSARPVTACTLCVCKLGQGQ